MTRQQQFSSLRLRLLDVVMALAEIPFTHSEVGSCGDALLRTVEDYALSDEVLRRSIEIEQPGIMAGCMCREAIDGPRPDDCPCGERSMRLAIEKRRREVAAVLTGERSS